MTPSYAHIEGLYDSEYFDGGSGSLIIFIHGIGSSCESFIDQIKFFSQTHRVIAWGVPGYGTSSAIDCEYPEVDDYAERFRQFVDWMNLDQFHLMGHSLGALISAAFAAKHPERLSSLSLCSVPLGYGREPVAVQQERMLNRIYDLCVLGSDGMASRRGPRLLSNDAPENLVDRVVSTMSKVRYDGYAQAAHMLSKADVKELACKLPSWLCVLLFVGSRDHITPPPATVRRFCSVCPMRDSRCWKAPRMHVTSSMPMSSRKDFWHSSKTSGSRAQSKLAWFRVLISM